MMSPLILLQLGFVQSDRYSSIYIPADGQLDQHHLLKLFFCFSIVLFLLLCKNKTKQKQKQNKKQTKQKTKNKTKNKKQKRKTNVCRYVGLFLDLVFNSILTNLLPIPCSFYYYCSVVQLEISDGDTSRVSFSELVVLAILGFLVFPYETDYFKVCKELCWNFNGN